MTEQLTHSPITKAREAEVNQSYEDLEDLLELTPPQKKFLNDVLFIIGVWVAKVESQEIPGVTGKFGLRVKK